MFKSSSGSPTLVELSADAISANNAAGRQTNIVIDTNIMIAIESAYRTGYRHKALKSAGVLEFVKAIGSSRTAGVFLSPGPAYQELPPFRRKSVEAAFERFIKDYLPRFSDDPNSIKVPFPDGKAVPEQFKDISLERQMVIACSYASLLAMNTIDACEDLTADEKFALYIDYCVDVLDLVSLKELSIARYAFAPHDGITDDARKRVSAIRSNFLKLKKGAGKGLQEHERIKRIALNGANDLKLISSADMIDNSREVFSFGTVNMDVWIATSDEKLFEFCSACPGFLVSSSGGPLARYVDTHADITRTRYWRDSFSLQERVLNARIAKVFGELDISSIVASALQMEVKLEENQAKEFMKERRWRAAETMRQN